MDGRHSVEPIIKNARKRIDYADDYLYSYIFNHIHMKLKSPKKMFACHNTNKFKIRETFIEYRITYHHWYIDIHTG